MKSRSQLSEKILLESSIRILLLFFHVDRVCEFAEGRKRNVQVGKLEEYRFGEEFRNERRGNAGSLVPADFLGLLETRPSLLVVLDVGDLLQDSVKLHPSLYVLEPEFPLHLAGNPVEQVEQVGAVAPEKGSRNPTREAKSTPTDRQGKRAGLRFRCAPPLAAGRLGKPRAQVVSQMLPLRCSA